MRERWREGGEGGRDGGREERKDRGGQRGGKEEQSNRGREGGKTEGQRGRKEWRDREMVGGREKGRKRGREEPGGVLLSLHFIPITNLPQLEWAPLSLQL